MKNLSKIRAAALMLALWALFLLSAMVISWALQIDSRLALSGDANRILQAEAMACSGAEVALHPLIKPGSPNLSRRFDGRQSYETRITGEGGRIDLNWIAINEDEHREILSKYLERKGIELTERDRMMDCLFDWIDPDNLEHLNGVEDEGDYRPANAMLARIEELKKVKGWAEFTSKPGWDEDLTVNTRGPIDIMWASRDVLSCLPGVTENSVDNFLKIRRGLDEIDGTADDAKLSVKEALAALGFSQPQIEELGKRELVAASPVLVFRIVSVGKSSDTTRVVQMVVRKGGGLPQMITWKEL